MALFDFKGFFNNNKEGYSSEAQNAKSLNDKRVEFNQQESVSAAEKRIIGSILASEEGGLSSLLDLLSGKGLTNQNQSGEAGITSGSPQERFWQFFTNSGFSKAATAGMMGNIDQESGFKGTAVELSGGGGFGIIQWTDTKGSPRRSNLEKYAAEKGKEPGDFQMQMEYLLYELENTNNWISKNPQGMGTHPYSEFKTTNDPEWAAAAFCWGYERPAPKSANISGRKKWARTHFDNFKNWTPSASSATGSFANPSEGVLTSPYGMRTHPVSGKRKMHKGIDVAGSGNTLVAADAGTVEFARNGHNGGFGNYLKINHGTINGVKIDTIYAHLASISVSSGQSVTKGQKIGIRGTTGTSTGIHLHFEVHENGNHVDPLKYVKY